MKKKWSAFLCAAALVLCAGCSNYQHVPLPEYVYVPKMPPEVELPMRWIYLLGKNVDKAPEITSLDVSYPYVFDIPEGCVMYGSGLFSAALTTVDEAYQHYFMRPNMYGATLKTWRDIFRRVLTVNQKYNDVQERGFITEEGIEGFDITGTKVIDDVTYKYRIACVLYDDMIYMAECYGKVNAFRLIEDAFDRSVLSSDLAVFRIRRDRSEQYTFFAYDPILVNVPKCRSGLLHPNWFIVQLGFCPYVQLLCSQTNVYGLNLNLFSSQQQCTAGISFGLLNASKEHYGLQLAGIASSAEKNYGMNISSIYTAAKENHGLSIGLVTVSEGESIGVQIGLLNFSTSPYHLKFFPFFSFPFFK